MLNYIQLFLWKIVPSSMERNPPVSLGHVLPPHGHIRILASVIAMPAFLGRF